MNWNRISSGVYDNDKFVITRRDPRLWELSWFDGITRKQTQHSTLRQAQAHAVTVANRDWTLVWQADGDVEAIWEYHGNGFYATATTWQEELPGPIKHGYALYTRKPGDDPASWNAPNYLGGAHTTSLAEAKTIAARGPQN